MAIKKKENSTCCEGYCPLNVQAFALALAILFAIGMFLLALVAWRFGLGASWVELCGEFHKGYSATMQGAVLGAVWGFIDGLAVGAVFAYLYNKLLK